MLFQSFRVGDRGRADRAPADIGGGPAVNGLLAFRRMLLRQAVGPGNLPQHQGRQGAAGDDTAQLDGIRVGGTTTLSVEGDVILDGLDGSFASDGNGATEPWFGRFPSCASRSSCLRPCSP